MEAGRIALIACVAVLAPLGWPGVRERALARVPLAGLIATVGLLSAFPRWQAWVVLILVVTGAAATRPPREGWEVVGIASALTAALAALLLVDPSVARQIWSGGRHEGSRTAIVLLGFLLATVAWGVVVEMVIDSLAHTLPGVESAAKEKDVPEAGRLIGWLERALIYGAVLLGRAEVVAIVIALKSIARLPQLRNEAFGEYFLIGTLMSIIGAIASAVVVRRLLGLELV